MRAWKRKMPGSVRLANCTLLFLLLLVCLLVGFLFVCCEWRPRVSVLFISKEQSWVPWKKSCEQGIYARRVTNPLLALSVGAPFNDL